MRYMSRGPSLRNITKEILYELDLTEGKEYQNVVREFIFISYINF